MNKVYTQTKRFREIKSPYSVDDPNDTCKMQLQRYLNDGERMVIIEGRCYFKIFTCAAYSIEKHDFTTIVRLDNRIVVKTGEYLIDENGVSYCVKGIPLIRYASDQYPECWKR